MQRLATRAQFQAVLAGKTIARSPHFALHQLVGELVCMPLAPTSALRCDLLFPVCDVWIGAMVPKRWAKRAVTRNAIKRQVYTISRERQQDFPATAHLVRLRSGFDKSFFVSGSSVALKQAVRAELHQLLNQMLPGART